MRVFSRFSRNFFPRNIKLSLSGCEQRALSLLATKTPRVESVSRAPLALFRPGSLRDSWAAAPASAALCRGGVLRASGGGSGSPSRSASGPLRHQGQRRRAGTGTVRERSSKPVRRVLGSGNLPALRRASPEERRRQQHQRLRHLRPAPTSALPRHPAA